MNESVTKKHSGDKKYSVLRTMSFSTIGMKKFLPYILMFVIAVGFFNPSLAGAASAYENCVAENRVLAETASDGTVYQDCSRLPGAPSDAYKPTSLGSAIFGGSGADCGLSPTTWATCFSHLFVWISYLILGLVSLVLWMAGVLLDYVLKYTILGMSENIKNLAGINIAWKTIKDLMNILFIFLLVYEGILLIIGQSDVGKIRKFITGIVLAALLINFSLFFTKVLIDASNIVTIGFYNSIIAQSSEVVNPSANYNSTTGNIDQAISTGTISGLSVPFMKALGVSSFFSKESISQMSSNSGGDTNLIIIGLAGSILFLIVSFVFFAVSMMFIIRYIALIVLLMLSPIAYMGMALPFMQKYAKEWWESLQGQLLFAPVYMLMTWVVLTLMFSGGFITQAGPDGWSKLLVGSNGAGSQGSISLLFNFVVIIGLIITTLVISKNIAKKGSDLISSATKNLTAFAGGKIVGGAAKIGRSTVGAAGQAVANNQWLRERAPDSRLARTALSLGSKTGSASFDARATSSFGALTDKTGVKVGKAGGKGGYQKDREDKINKRMEFFEKNVMADTITGNNVENEMTNRRWNSLADYNYLQNTVGLSGAQIASINATGTSKNQIEALGINARQAELMRRRVQTDLNRASEQENLNRKDRYLHNLSQTHWYTPNLYSGVSEDAEAAKRMRDNKKAKKGGKDKILADLAAVLKEEEPETTPPTGGAPTTPTPPAAGGTTP